MKFYVATGIFLLVGCSQVHAKDCSKRVLGTWESKIPVTDDSGKVRSMPEMDLLVSYKPDGNFVSLMKRSSDPKERSIVATGSWTCIEEQLTLSIKTINGRPPRDPVHNVMVTTYKLRHVGPNSFDNFWGEEDTTLHFMRSNKNEPDHLPGPAP
jgi:hypothetical protein